MDIKKKGILFAVFEAAPFIKTGGLGDVGGALPPALKREGCSISVVMPKLSAISGEYRDNMEHVTDFTMTLAWRSLYCGVDRLVRDGVTYYFIDNQYYFFRDKLYGYGDDAERVAFFSKAVLESIMHIPELHCEIIHCNDWHTALIPVFLREFYQNIPEYQKIKTVFTVHNLKFQGIFPRVTFSDVLGLDENSQALGRLAYNDCINLMKGALYYSNVISTVSPTYAQEIKSEYFGEGLEYVFNDRNDSLYGILNGIDTGEYNPETDTSIPVNFSARNAVGGKQKNKAALQERIGLKKLKNTPLIVMISRLTEQKGLDLFLRILDELLCEDVQVAVLGTGDECYESALRSFENWHRGQMCSYLSFDPALSHLFYAGADMLVMPSRFEPCGLSQMIAMRYGTLPVVRETGGLRDSVIPYNKFTGEGTGFSFANFNAHELLFVLKDAIQLYYDDQKTWRKIMNQAMKTDVSWTVHAREYIDMYEKLFDKQDSKPLE